MQRSTMNKQILITLLAITIISFAYASTCLGDTNGDGVADASDYINIKNHFGYNCSEVDCAGADLDGDGLVGYGDLMIFQANAGNNCNIKEPEPTPEPTPTEEPLQPRISGGGHCVTKWECTNWTDCSVSGKQYRTCIYNKNWCKPTYSKPTENQTCDYVAPSVEKEPINETEVETPVPEEIIAPEPLKTINGLYVILAIVGVIVIIILAYFAFRSKNNPNEIPV